MQKFHENKLQSFSEVADHLKNPLTPIMGWADVLQDFSIMGNLTPAQLRAIKVISYNAGKLDNTIENLIDSEKLSKGQMIYEKHSFKMNDVFSSLSSYFKLTLTDKKITLTINQDHPKFIYGDKRRIEQILTNLLDFVIALLPDKNGKIELNVKAKEPQFEFRIRFTGYRPNLEIQQMLLKEGGDFFSVHGTSHFDPPFGLKISKGLVEGMGGKIGFDEDGNSFSFYFTICD